MSKMSVFPCELVWGNQSVWQARASGQKYVLSSANGWLVSFYLSPNQKSDCLLSYQHHRYATQPWSKTVLLELEVLWNHVNAAYCVAEKFKLNLNSKCEDSAQLFLCKSWKCYCDTCSHSLETEKSLIKNIALHDIILCMCVWDSIPERCSYL